MSSLVSRLPFLVVHCCCFSVLAVQYVTAHHSCKLTGALLSLCYAHACKHLSLSNSWLTQVNVPGHPESNHSPRCQAAFPGNKALAICRHGDVEVLCCPVIAGTGELSQLCVPSTFHAPAAGCLVRASTSCTLCHSARAVASQAS